MYKRIMDWKVINELGINEELERQFLTTWRYDNNTFSIPIWTRDLDVKEDSYHEWMFKFYLSLSVKRNGLEHLVVSTKMIKFCLGGEEYHFTVPEFGRFRGLGD